MSGYFYILANKRIGTLYSGVTNDLTRRVSEHKTGATKGFTSRYKTHKLVYFEEYDDITEAIHREKCVKEWKREWKLELIEKFNPDWKDLYNNFIQL
ncbi:MAG: GIY-YIG nuclease family protein [Bdellovibrionales bacterium]